MITFHKVIDTTKTVSPKTVPTATPPAKSTSTNFYTFLTFLLVTITLLIAVYCYLVKYRPKQTNLFPDRVTNTKLKEVLR